MLRSFLAGLLVCTIHGTAAASGKVTEIGTPHPVRLLAAAPDAHWVAICQARKDTDKNGTIAVSPGFNGDYGDQMSAFFVFGTGPGVAIDDLVESDPSGHFAVLLRRGRLVLLDTWTRREIDLSARGAYSKPARAASGAYLGVSFDAEGKRLSYVALRKNKPLVVVRELTSGKEVKIDPGSGKLWSAALDPSGTRVLIEVVPQHFPNDRWPGLFRHLRCETRSVSDVEQATGDEPSMRIASVNGGVALDDPHYLAVLGEALLRRDETGALLLVEASGAHELLPAACKPIVRRVDAEKQRVLAHCAALGEHAHPILAAVGATRVLDLPAISANKDDFAPFGRHAFSSTRDANDTILDLETNQRWLSAFSQSRLDGLGPRTLVSRNQHLIVLDGPNEADLGGGIAEYPALLSAGTLRYVEPLLVDLATGTLLGEAPERELPLFLGSAVLHPVKPSVLAIANDGRLLGTYHVHPSGFPDGPLEWLTPAPPLVRHKP